MPTRVENPYRLPQTIWPSAYHLHLTPDLERHVFSGTLTVELDVRTETDTVVFNAVDLSLGTCTVTDAVGKTHRADAVHDEHFETATLILPASLPVGPASLQLSFTGELNDQLRGFYRSTYVDEDGVTHTIATTQFESTDARRAFPCWDEPVFKSVFNVTLTVPGDLAAFSNSPERSRTINADGTATCVFGPTMKMSTYIVAFVVGPFEATRTVDVDGIALRTITPIGKVHLGEFALEIGAFALRWFASYFAIPYPGDKMDQIAIPDFAFGAMENLGCVTYRETALLVDPASASLPEVMRVAEVVAHETAHMWFGDLVTMEWWEGIWLNEAFATFMANACVDAFRPEWKTWIGFGTSRDMALAIDGLHSTRPIEYDVISPSDSQGMFDLLTYEKGGSVLRMLELYLGADVFRDGIRIYLKRHAYANTVTSDLWDALEQASSQPVREIMDTWILQGGHPLVTYENNTLRQTPFSYGAAEGASNIGSNWLVPVATRRANGGAVDTVLLGDQPIELTADGPVVVNAGGGGVFRTRYGKAELSALTSDLSKLEELERVVLVADTWAGLFASTITYEEFVTVARALGDESNPTTWTTVAQALDWISRGVDESQRPVVALLARELFSPVLARWGYDPSEGEDELIPQLRSLAIVTLGILGADEAVQREATTRFDQNRLVGDTARAFLRVVAATNRPGDYERFLEGYATATDPQTEQRFLQSLADFPDEAQALDAARRAFDEFRTQDGPVLLNLLTSSRRNGPVVWKYMTSRWSDVTTLFASNLQYRVTAGVATYINDEAFSREVRAFHESHPLEVGQRTLTQYLERMRVGEVFARHMKEQVR